MRGKKLNERDFFASDGIGGKKSMPWEVYY